MRWRRDEPLPRAALTAGAVGTLAVHVVITVALVLAVFLERSGHQPAVYSVELVAAPAQTRPATRRPVETPPPPPPPTVPPVRERAAPVPAPKPPPKVPPKTEPAAKPVEVPPPSPGATPATGADVDNVRVEGVQFPYPEYLRKIMNEILRRWARPLGSAGLTAEVAFTIARDGAVSSIRLIRSSRSYTFDLEAQGAVEQAAADRAFGPLPAGWPADVLNVAFLFTPRPR